MMGHLEVVKWLLTNHTYLCFSPSATSMVARNGNLEMLQWIHRQENQVEWSSDVRRLIMGISQWQSGYT
ncbi:hypothetical protein PC129_g8787 [Phytophthora cactorum]|nr:hypothetical protein Pcac1_g28028 [Phytophthora cactorum]KAG2825250.1 hypothetical protein PC111_g9479 [Phytophthora cactorum]KAG2826062.1 hypothetical protein PC112_g9438 [Phytophthora cactorum]KAG2856838.1 hypothetical protein PC113_g11222 [Phytophthora cactorum]KAG2908606.1 hypothetical protein PC114_g10392 [Phytophthora cactorum]